MELTVDINGDCNIDCAFCYQTLDGSSHSVDDVFKIANEHPNAAVVGIGGGEPFLHPKLIEIIQGLRDKDKSVHISTNATIIPQGFLELAEKTREGVQVQVSLHASNPQLYAKITGHDLFARVMENTRIVKEYYSTLLTAAIYQENVDSVPGIVQLSKDLALPLRVNLVFPIGKGRTVDLLTQKQVDQLKGYLLGQYLVTKGRVTSPLVHMNNCAAIENAYGIEKKASCPVDSSTKLYVSPQKEHRRCEFLPQEVYTP